MATMAIIGAGACALAALLLWTASLRPPTDLSDFDRHRQQLDALARIYARQHGDEGAKEEEKHPPT